jgi:hypothetical protein
MHFVHVCAGMTLRLICFPVSFSTSQTTHFRSYANVDSYDTHC